MIAINNGTDLRALSAYDAKLFDAYFMGCAHLRPWQHPRHLHFGHIMAQPYLVLWQIINHALCIFGRTENDFFLFTPPLANYTVEKETEECFKIIEREGHEPKIMYDFEAFWHRVNPDNYEQELSEICHITDLDAVLGLEGEAFKNLHTAIAKFKQDYAFSYNIYHPELHTAKTNQFIRDNITQTPEKLDAQYIENLLQISSKCPTLGARILILQPEGKIGAISITCLLNDNTAGQLVNLCDPSVENIAYYIRWRSHQDAKRFGCHFMNIGTHCDDADLINLWEDFNPIGILKTHSWKRGKVSPFIDMNGI